MALLQLFADFVVAMWALRELSKAYIYVCTCQSLPACLPEQRKRITSQGCMKTQLEVMSRGWRCWIGRGCFHRLWLWVRGWGAALLLSRGEGHWWRRWYRLKRGVANQPVKGPLQIAKRVFECFRPFLMPVEALGDGEAVHFIILNPASTTNTSTKMARDQAKNMILHFLAKVYDTYNWLQYINKEDPNSASTIANKWGHAYFNIDFHFPGSTRSCSSCIPLFVHNCEACIKLKIKQKPVELKLESYQIPPPCSNQKPDMLSVCSEFCKNILKLVMKVTLKICTLV